MKVAYGRVKPLIPSRTLSDSMFVADDPRSSGRIRSQLLIPHYWALYVHDGRGPFGPRNARYLCFFPDPKDDPRLRGGYPVRDTDIRHLTAREFWNAIDENRARRKRGEPPFMIVLKRMPNGENPRPFFTVGLSNFGPDVWDMIRDAFPSYLEALATYDLPKFDDIKFTLGG